MSEVDLFLSAEGEELYKKLKEDSDSHNALNDSYAWHKYARKHINNIYSQYETLLDKKFITQFPFDLLSSLWELKLLVYLNHLKQGTVEAVPSKGKISIPDFKWSVGDNDYYMRQLVRAPDISILILI